MKFVVAVFAVTLAIFGSMPAKAKIAESVRCNGSAGACAKTESGHWLSGARS